MGMPDILSKEECRQILEKCLQGDNYYDFTADIKPIEGDQVGFMSEQYKIRLEVNMNDGSKREFQFFAKAIPRKVTIFGDFVQNSGVYFKETMFYSKVVPDLQKYLVKVETAISDSEESYKSVRWIPQCFFCRSDLIVLQDLSIYNFKLFSSRELMDLQHCSLVLKEIANFHSSTIILEEKHTEISGKPCIITDFHPNVFDEKITNSLPDDAEKGWFKAGIRALIPLVDLLPKYKGKVEEQKTIRNKITDACNRMQILLGKSNKYRNVVCHGDLWANNMLIQYNNKGEPQETRFIDFQWVRYTPPAHDVICFLYLVTNRAFREANLDALLSIYYNALSLELRRNNLNPDQLLSYKEFKESCDYLKELGAITAVLYYQMLLIKGEIITPIYQSSTDFKRFLLTDRSAEVCKSFLEDEIYRTRLNEAMEELIECYILVKN